MSNVVDTVAKYTYGTWRAQRNWRPLEIVGGDGCYVTDSSGKKYLDFSSQLICVNLGYGNKAVIDAMTEQAKTLPYIAPSHTSTVRAELARLLIEVLPKGLEKFFFSPSGTEANEAAIKIARHYTGKHKIISRYRSYHGCTAASMAATGEFRRWFAEPLGKVDGVVFGPEAYCYRCPLKLEYPDCGIACAEYIGHMIKQEGNVAAVMLEPVVGTNGVLVPPDEYLPMIREITEESNVLLIADEVMCGWGRVGEWFAVDRWKVRPDILTTAKGITSAYFPLGLTATTRPIAEFFDDHYFAHGHTYEAHPIGLAAAVACIREYKRLDLINRAKTIGDYVGKRLAGLKEKHPSVGDVRGMGLFWAIELVKDRRTKEPFNTVEDKVSGKGLIVDKMGGEALKQGLMVFSWINHFIIAPPLIVTEEEVDYGVDVMDRVLAIADQKLT